MIEGLEITGCAIAGIIVNGATNITIGGSTPGQGNVISGNPSPGIALAGAGTSRVVVAGNRIGTDATGMDPLPNTTGVSIVGATANTIGGNVLAARNVISGNRGDGIDITGPGGVGAAALNVVEGNYIGTNAAGKAALANGGDGVNINGQATNNTIGGNVATELNLISGNAQAGVLIAGKLAIGNTVGGNQIGTDSSGTASLGQCNRCVDRGRRRPTRSAAWSSAPATSSPATRQTASRSTAPGRIGNAVAGNLIGTNAAGTAALVNGADGVSINAGAPANTIGGMVAAAGNVISGNTTDGVEITGAGSTGNVVAGNFIGTNAAGTAALANGADGVSIDGGAIGNTVGGMVAAAGNVISGNTTNGVEITGAGSNGNVVAGNLIGTNAAGTAALANGADGVSINAGASANTIGGMVAAAGNVISGNTTNGVEIYRRRVEWKRHRGELDRYECRGDGGIGQRHEMASASTAAHGQHDRRHGHRGPQRHLRQHERRSFPFRRRGPRRRTRGKLHRYRCLWSEPGE